MQQRSKTAAAPAEQTIEQLRERYQELNEQKIRSETQLQNAKDQLESLKRQAREAYGTDDVNELSRKLEALKAENEEKRRSYQSSLDQIERELEAVEQTFAAAENPSAAKG